VLTHWFPVDHKRLFRGLEPRGALGVVASTAAVAPARPKGSRSHSRLENELIPLGTKQIEVFDHPIFDNGWSITYFSAARSGQRRTIRRRASY
jgi:hypothetical protein